MLKKMVLWSLYAAFLGILLAGAAYRTSIKLTDEGQEQNRGQAGNQQSGNDALILPAGEQEDRSSREWRAIDGQVTGISERGLSVQLSNGQLIELSGRAWRYAQGFGFNVQDGDALWLEGYFENGAFEVTRMTCPANGQSVLLRDSNGHPLWNGESQ
ncbi:MAG: hypothetical protein ACOYYJ_16455 [Chloroflexota bacterium]